MLVVPTRQRAAAVRLAYTAARLAEGRQIWNSPEVLTWPIWLQQRSAARADPQRHLTSVEEWLLWNEAVAEVTAERELLLPQALVDDVQRAAMLIEEWQLELRVPVTEEAALLMRAMAGVARRRHSLGAEQPDRWRRDSDALPVPTLFAGFAQWSPANRRLLIARGARFVDEAASSQSVPDPGPDTVIAAADTDDELRRMAGWCRERLLADPRARLLVLVPDLAARAAPLRRALSAALQAELHALEGGVPLSSYPLAQAALAVLQLATRRVDFDVLALILRSPWLGFDAAQARLDLELWLREQNLTACDSSSLQRVMPQVGAGVGAAAAAALLRLVEPLRTLPADQAPCSQWARRFATLLTACRWAEAGGLHSPELQVRARFDQLLGEFAAGDEAGGVLDAQQAVDAFSRWLGRARFEPATDDVAVTVSAELGDPLVRYDGIWVMGLTADAWPLPPAPDPLIPLSLQMAAGVPSAHASARLTEARLAMAAWRRCSDQLRLSWPRQREGIDMQPSPLLPAHDGKIGAEPADPLAGLWQDGVLEGYGLQAATPWTAMRRLPGGTRTLELQSACPFRACAELRLDCAPLPEPQPGIDARTRGQILHRALQYLWLALGGSQGLLQPQATLEELCAQCAARAVRQQQTRLLVAPHPRLLEVERQRTRDLLLALLDSERSRTPFNVLHVEHDIQATLAGFPLQLRLDRVDAFADGAVAIIDYKSGAWRGFDALALRPSHPQLLAYATALQLPVAALAAVYASARGVRWAGVADRGDRIEPLPGVDEFTGDWSALRTQWRAQVEQLAAAFGAGEAAVDPAPQACQYCHLRLLCRVETERLEGADD